MKESKGKLLLFDIDGVIVDSFAEVYSEVKKFIKDISGNDLEIEQYRKFFESNPLDQIAKVVGSKMVLMQNKEEMKKFFAIYDQTKIFDGISELLKDLAVENTLVAITSSIVEAVTDRLDKEGLVDLFAAFLGPRAAFHKDKKIKMAMKEFGYGVDQTIFISDTSGDILEAKKAGVPTVAVTWGYHTKETLEKVKPDHIANNIKELKELLTKG